MNCIRAQHQFVAYLHGETTPEQSTDLLNHVAACADCRAKFAFERLLQDTLRILPVPAQSAGFTDRVFAGLENTRPALYRRPWFGAVMAASLTFCVTLGYLAYQATGDSASEVALIEMRVDEVKWVKLRFNAPRDFDQVTLSLRLPSHMELQGYPGEREISWNTRLQAGTNELNLPVIALQPVDGAIVASIKGTEKTKEFKVFLKAIQEEGRWESMPSA